MQFIGHNLAGAVELTATVLLLLLTSAPAATGRPAYDRRWAGRVGDSALFGPLANHQNPLHVVVTPDVTTIDSKTEQVRVTCSASAAATAVDNVSEGDQRDSADSTDEPPYITFYWMVVEQTSMPLSSNIPGVTVVHQRPTSGLIDVESLVNLPPKKRHQRRRHGGDDNSNNNYNSNKRRLASNADVVMSDGKSAAVAELPDIVVSRLVIDSRFYHVLRYGDNKFACKAHTLTGRRASGFFIIRKV